MLAVYRAEYCAPGAVQIKEVPDPVAGPGQLLVRVRAVTVNRTDLGVLTGRPWVMRLFTGLSKPRSPVPGTDFVGVVEACGAGVTRFQPGDWVWGFKDEGLSSHAQLVAVPENGNVVPVPQGVSPEDCVASAEAAHYALNFLRGMEVTSGDKIMVNGGTGAIGSALIQLLTRRGAEVTATCRPEHMQAVEALGAHRVIDYTTTDFTRLPDKYKHVFDAVGKSRYKWCKHLILPGGYYLSSELGPRAENVYLPLLTRFSTQRTRFPIPVNIPDSLRTMCELLARREFKPLIDPEQFQFKDMAKAYAYVNSGAKVGNVVVKLNP